MNQNFVMQFNMNFDRMLNLAPNYRTVPVKVALYTRVTFKLPTKGNISNMIPKNKNIFYRYGGRINENDAE